MKPFALLPVLLLCVNSTIAATSETESSTPGSRQEHSDSSVMRRGKRERQPINKVVVRKPNLEDSQTVRNAKDLDQRLEMCMGPAGVCDFMKTVVKDVFGSLVPLGISGLSSACVARLGISEVDRSMENIFAFAQMNAVQKTIQSIVENLQRCKINEADALFRLREALKKDFDTDALPEPTKELIQGLDEEFDRAIMPYISRVGRSWSYEMEGSLKRILIYQLRVRQSIFLAIPVEPVNVAHFGKGGDVELRKQTSTAVDELVKTFPEEARESIQDFIQVIRMNSMLPDTVEDDEDEAVETIFRAQRYFYGPPGTGKTFAAESIARALDLPMCRVSLEIDNDMHESLTNVLFGRNPVQGVASAFAGSEPPALEKVPGEILGCMIKHGVTNPLIFIDEAGPSLNDRHQLQLLLKLFDPNRKTISVGGGLFDVRIDKVSFILTGNVAISAPALRDRLPTVEFDRAPEIAKAKNFERVWKASVRRMERVFGEEEAKKIADAVEPFREVVIAADKENVGCRSAERVIKAVFSHAQLAFAQSLGSEIADFGLDEDKIRKIIKKESKECEVPVTEISDGSFENSPGMMFPVPLRADLGPF
ncbi:MAG: hypothetical protein SGCHY_005048 [Lobulomycetales sp.]